MKRYSTISWLFVFAIMFCSIQAFASDAGSLWWLLQNNNLDGAYVSPNTITNAQLGLGSVTTDKIVDNSIWANNIDSTIQKRVWTVCSGKQVLSVVADGSLACITPNLCTPSAAPDPSTICSWSSLLYTTNIYCDSATVNGTKNCTVCVPHCDPLMSGPDWCGGTCTALGTCDCTTGKCTGDNYTDCASDWDCDESKTWNYCWTCHSPVDACGVCGWNGSSCAGCDWVPNSGKVVDACGVCGWNGSTCVGTWCYDSNSWEHGCDHPDWNDPSWDCVIGAQTMGACDNESNYTYWNCKASCDTTCTPSCPLASNVCSGTTDTRSNGCGWSCNVVGTKDCTPQAQCWTLPDTCAVWSYTNDNFGDYNTYGWCTSGINEVYCSWSTGGCTLNANGCCGTQTKDCNGTCGGSAQIDSCGVCGWDGSSCGGCWWSTYEATQCCLQGWYFEEMTGDCLLH